MQYIHQLTRSCVILGLLAFALVVGFSGMALADEKAAETKASGEKKAEGETKAEDEGEMKAEGEGEKKAEGEGEKKAEGETKAEEAK